jgi:aspartyl-tRNA(Asn)/glutamyl-tRNA(Gln) amidotransferase subunit C
VAGGFEEVRRIAQLARLRLSDEEAALYQGQFARILELVSQLSSLDASAVVSQPQPSSVMRDDEAQPFLEPEALIGLAPERDGVHYKVKKVLE